MELKLGAQLLVLTPPGVNVVPVLTGSALAGCILAITSAAPGDSLAPPDGLGGVKGIRNLVVEVDVHEQEVMPVGGGSSFLFPGIEELN